MSQSISILVVEDSAIQRVMLCRLLKEAGYLAPSVPHGQKALEFINENRVDLILSDISMPGMDGFELCRTIKNHPQHRQLPVILLTALSNPKEAIRGLSAGADNFLTKPFDNKTLLYRIKQQLQSPIEQIEDDSSEVIVIPFAGEEYSIASSRRKALNLLVSTYENAVEKNRKLHETQLELKQLNEELEQRVDDRTRQLKEANQAQNDFVNNMTHELRTPLNAIIGLSEMLKDTKEIPEDKRDILEIIHQSGSSLLVLVNTLLDFSRLEKGNLETKHKEFNLYRQLKQALKPHMTKAEEKGLYLLCQIEPFTPKMVTGDLRRIHSILHQIVDNAIKFTSEGHVIITVAVTFPQKEPPHLHITVEDSGVGNGGVIDQ
ncbi:hybrid sensor histidine kinase/response regulator [Magnetococcales bacterium HHB-1]